MYNVIWLPIIIVIVADNPSPELSAILDNAVVHAASNRETNPSDSQTADSNGLSAVVAADTDFDTNVKLLPDWVVSGLSREPESIDPRFIISSSQEFDVEMCHADISDRLLDETRAFLDKYVLDSRSADIPFLTKDYVNNHFLQSNPDRTYVQTINRPSGESFRVFKELSIPESCLKDLLQWERNQRTQQVTYAIGGVGAVAVVLLGGFSSLIGLFMPRPNKASM